MGDIVFPYPFWRSSPDDVALHPDGPFVTWEGLQVTRLPLIDTKHGVFARLTYKDALAVAQKLGARFGTAVEFDRIHAKGFEPKPCIGSLSKEELDLGPSHGYDVYSKATYVDSKTGKTLKVSDRERGRLFSRLMATLPWARRHDECLWSRLEGWDKQRPVSNAGKQWLAGPKSKGMAVNYGWYDPKAPNGRMWQGRGDTHDDGHTDYSQLTMLFKGSPAVGAGGGGMVPGVPPKPGDAAGGLSAGADSLVRELTAVCVGALSGTLLGWALGQREGAAVGVVGGTFAGLLLGRKVRGTAGPA